MIEEALQNTAGIAVVCCIADSSRVRHAVIVHLS